MSRSTASFPIWFLVLTAVALAWQAWGAIDLFRTGRFGYSLNTDNIVQQVSPHSPAEKGGLLPGDQLLTVDGISIDDPSIANRPRTTVGTQVRLRVNRDGLAHTFPLTAGPLTPSTKTTSLINSAIGIAFLLAAWMVRRHRHDRATTLFTYLGLTAALLFVWTPWVGTGIAGRALGWVLNVLVLVACALFLHLVWYLPRPRPLLRRQGLIVALYVPAIVDIGLALGALIAADATGGVFALIAGYLNRWAPRIFLILALVFIASSFLAYGPDERRLNGLRTLLIGTMVSVIPYVVLGIAAGSFGLPPALASLSLLVLPFALAVAVLGANTNPTINRTDGIN